MIDQTINTKTIDSAWKPLYRIGAVVALIMLVFIPIQGFVYFKWPPPTAVNDWFTLFQKNPFLGLLSLDFFYIIDNVFMILIYLAFYASLKQTNKYAVVIALSFGLVGLASYYPSNTAFEMLSLSNQFRATTIGAERAMLLAAGQTMLAVFKGTAFNVYYVLNAFALLIFAVVMLRSKIFSKVTAYWGILAGILMLIPSTAGKIGVIFSFTSLVPWMVFSVLFARRLFQLGSVASKEGGAA